MTTLKYDTFFNLDALSLIAKGLSLISILILALFFIGEGFNPSKIQLNEWILFLFFPFGLITGMVVAWWKEGLGAMIAVGSLVGFYLAHFLQTGGLPRGWAFLAFAVPGFLFLVHWLITRFNRQD